jgi:glyoxylase-like metal-dependent hydrolase (beta-lactamase superfamily II)
MDVERVELVQPHYGPVNAYRVGDTLVDTGHVCQASLDRLRHALDSGPLDGIERVVLTHPHIDHVGGSLSLPAVTSLPHVVFEGADALLRDYDEYLRTAREEMATIAARGPEVPEPDGRYFPLDRDYAMDQLVFERVLGPGHTVRLGGGEWEAIHTPGHSRQHMALYHPPSGDMLSGDIVSRNGHFMYGPVHWDIGEYKQGLGRIREVDPDRLLPGHGEPMADPTARVEDALAKAEAAEAAILEAVAEHGRLHARDLAREALNATDETVAFLGTVAAAYAVYLADRGRLDVEWDPGVIASPA